MGDALDERAAALPEWMRDAGALARDHLTRADPDEAQREVQSLLRRRVSERFPEDGESWRPGPLDGRGNFARGIPHYAVSLAYVRGGGDVVELAAVFAPETNELFIARRGGGATLNGTSIACSDRHVLTRSIVALGYSTRTDASADAFMRTVQGLLAEPPTYRLLGTPSLTLCHVACGAIDASYEANAHPQDLEAAMLVVEEAGGKVQVGAAGRGSAVVAGNPRLFERLLRISGAGERTDDGQGQHPARSPNP